MSGYYYFNRMKFLSIVDQNESLMEYFGMSLRLWIDKTPIENYKNSRGIK